MKKTPQRIVIILIALFSNLNVSFAQTELNQKQKEEAEREKRIEDINKNLKSPPTNTTEKSPVQNTPSTGKDIITIGIFAFKGIYKNYVLELQNQTVQSFSQKSRFTVVDRTNLSALKSEKELQKSEDFIDGYVVDQGKSFGAKYVVTGDLQNIGTVAKQFKKLNSDNTYSYSTQYSAYISFTLTLIETETGQIKSTQNFNLKSTDVGLISWFSSTAGFYNSENAALSAVMSLASANIKSWINSVFPVLLKIIKVEEFDKKGLPSVVLIKGGADTDLKKGSDLFVIYPEVIEVDGVEYTRPVDVGQIKVLEVDGEFSSCKIKSGADKIQELISQGKSITLSIKSYK
jgi:curli biogenesis system outer membrane secretion channel CsgG